MISPSFAALEEVLLRLRERDPEFADAYLRGALHSLRAVLRSKQIESHLGALRQAFYEKHQRIPTAIELAAIERRLHEDATS